MNCRLAVFAVIFGMFYVAYSAFAAPAVVPRHAQKIASEIASAGAKVEQIDSVRNVKGALKATISFSYFDPRGQEQTGLGVIYLPPAVLAEPSSKAPLHFGAGYEMSAGEWGPGVGGTGMTGAAGFIRRGAVVVTPGKTLLNPVARTPNLDIALLHIARRLPFIDDAKVTISGISAGGYMTFMLAAETFPLAAAAPMVAPVNFGYQTQYILYNYPHIKGQDGRPETSHVPVLALINLIVNPAAFTYYPRDIDDLAWFTHSPVAHADTITCPVLAVWSTADTAVPIHQVSHKLVRPHDSKLFPAGFKIEPGELMRSEGGRAELLPTLDEERYTLTIVPAPMDWPEADAGEAAAGKKASTQSIPFWNIPFSGTKPWNIVVLDEGPITPKAAHFRHEVYPNYDLYLQAKLAQPSAPDQLTVRKLERLMARYAGVEWLDSGLRHLDRPEAERADVLRGLLTYVNQGEPHARRFAELYSELLANQQALGAAARFSNPTAIRSALEALR